MAKRTDPATEAIVVSMYKEGCTVRKLSEEFELCESTITAILDRNNVARRKKEKKEDKKIMTELERKEWDFFAALIRGELKIVRVKKGE